MSLFTQKIREKKPKRSNFNLSHVRLQTSDFFKITPFLCREILPGDSFKVQSAIQIRMAPLQAACMQSINAYMHYFFVPHRLTVPKWPDFITRQPQEKSAQLNLSGTTEGANIPTLNIRSMTLGSYDEQEYLNSIAPFYLGNGSLADYLGLDIAALKPRPNTGSTSSNSYKINIFPFLAYHLIWDQYYRDTDKQPEPLILEFMRKNPDFNFALGGGGATLDTFLSNTQDQRELRNLLQIRYKNYPKDYFTTCNSEPQHGAWGSQVFAPFNIRTLREASQIQEILDKDMRTGYRYTEFLKAYFNQNNRDESLQRPQYLGGGKQPIVINSVVQNSSSVTDSPIGSQVGIGSSFGADSGFKHHFTEHGTLLGLMTIVPTPSYICGVDRMYLRTRALDFYLPEFQNIGEQEVYNVECFNSSPDVTSHKLPMDVMGYQTRDAAYKVPPRQVIHGEFRSSLINMHTARDFSAHNPANFQQLISTQPFTDALYSGNPPENRIFQVTNAGFQFNESFWCEIAHKIYARRPMVHVAKPTLGYHNT